MRYNLNFAFEVNYRIHLSVDQPLGISAEKQSAMQSERLGHHYEYKSMPMFWQCIYQKNIKKADLL